MRRAHLIIALCIAPVALATDLRLETPDSRSAHGLSHTTETADSGVRAARTTFDLGAAASGTPGLRMTPKGLGLLPDGDAAGLDLPPVRIPPAADDPFVAAAVTWSTPTGGITTFLRTSRDGRAWSDWRPVREDPDLRSANRRFGELQFLAPEIGYLQLRVVLAGQPRSSPLLEDLAVALIRPGATQAPRSPSATDGAATTPVRPPVRSRTGWACPDGESSRWTPRYTTVSFLIVHHTAGANGPSDWPAVVRSIWWYHTVERGWGDIGYNYLVDPLGVVYEGRAHGDNVVGAHFSCANSGTMGTALLGTFESTLPTPAARASLTALLAWKAAQRGLDPHGLGWHEPSALWLDTISGHRDANPSTSPTACPSGTACPGASLHAELPRIRDEVARLAARPAAGRSDIDGDGVADLVWRHAPSGLAYWWKMAGTSIVSSAFLLSNDPSSSLRSLVDVDGDGSHDAVWQDTEGTVSVWSLRGGQVLSTRDWTGPMGDWRLAATLDLGRDGDIDFVWRHRQSGIVAYWELDGTELASYGYLYPDPIPTHWTIAGAGDIDRDGQADILWRDQATGAVAYWKLDGTSVTSGVLVACIPTDWQIAGAVDLAGNGTLDIVWRHPASGTTAHWEMSGTQIVASGNLPVSVPGDWEIVGLR